VTVVLLAQGAGALAEGTWHKTTASTCRLLGVDIYSGATEATQRAYTEAELTEPSFVGYTAVPLGSWTRSGGGPSVLTHTEVTFTCALAPVVPVTIHGYWVQRDSDSQAMWFEVFTTGPFIVSTAGDSLSFQPVLTLD